MMIIKPSTGNCHHWISFHLNFLCCWKGV